MLALLCIEDILGYVCKINVIEMEEYFADVTNKFYPYLMHTGHRFIYEET